MKDWQKMTLVAVAVLGIAAAGSQRTPLNRAFLQSNLDANGFNVTNLQGGVPGSIVAYDPDNGLMPTNVAFISNAYVTNLITSNVYATNIYVITGYVAELTVTNGLTNLSLTPNTVLQSDSGRQISSIGNGTGALTNDGAGNFGWNTAISGTQFVTNDGFYLHLWGTRTNVDAPWALSNDGELLEGTNALAGNLAPGFHTFGSVSYANSNQVPTQFFDMLSADYTGLHSYGLINGAAGYSPASASWSLRSGDIAGSTNSLAQQAHSGSAWVTASVDGTNRAQLSYPGVWDSQGYVDESGIDNQFVQYASGKRLTPTLDGSLWTNINNLSPGVSNFIASQASATNVVWPTQGTNVFLTTNGNAVKIDVPYQTALTNGLIPLPANASGALTNDGAGVLGWYPSFATQPGNNVMSGSNHFSGTITTSTNLVWGPDFSVEESCLSTNAAFTFAAPLGVDTAGKTVQWTLVNCTNTTAAAIAVTPPANCHAVGTMYVTNWTCFWFQCYANKITNCFGIPVW